MKTLITIAVTVLSLLALQQIDVHLYNRQFDVNVIVAQYEVDLVELRNYRHCEPDLVTNSIGGNMFEATPMMKAWSK